MDRMMSASPEQAIASCYDNYLLALLGGDRRGCRDFVQQLLDCGVGVKKLYTQVFQRSLYEIGALWEQHRISVATEHLATAVTESLMTMVHPQLFASGRKGRRAVVSCIANEYHQVGGKMVADIFELHGWDGFFLGANTPLSDLLSLVHEKKPEVLCLSVSLSENLPVLRGIIEQVEEEFPCLKLMVGGQAFSRVAPAAVTGATYVSDLTALEHFILPQNRVES